MESGPQFSPAVVICLVVAIVIAVNGVLVLAVRRGGSEVEMLRRVAKAARNPWGSQEKEMSELRERVAQLKSESTSNSGPEE